MNTISQMLRTSPRRSIFEVEALARCISECLACAQSCTACADAGLAEPDIDLLRRCIRLNLDCADLCATTALMLSRQLEPDRELTRRLIELQAFSCQLCGDECERHAERHEHCRLCSQACRRCEEACRALLKTVVPGDERTDDRADRRH